MKPWMYTLNRTLACVGVMVRTVESLRADDREHADMVLTLAHLRTQKAALELTNKRLQDEIVELYSEVDARAREVRVLKKYTEKLAGQHHELAAYLSAVDEVLKSYCHVVAIPLSARLISTALKKEPRVEA